MDMFALKNKTALVTGASRGLGKAMAIALARAGAKVICSSSRPGGTESTIQEIGGFGGQAVGIAADLSDRKSIVDLYDQTKEQMGTVDILVNNGGTIARYPAIDFPMDEWDKVIQVNLSAAFQLAQLFGKDMMAKKKG